VRAFLAGADALLMPPVPDAAYDALLAAAHSPGKSPRNGWTLRCGAFFWPRRGWG